MADRFSWDGQGLIMREIPSDKMEGAMKFLGSFPTVLYSFKTAKDMLVCQKPTCPFCEMEAESRKPGPKDWSPIGRIPGKMPWGRP